MEKQLPPQAIELNNYIDLLFEEIQEAMSVRQRNMKFELASLATYLIAVFLGNPIISSLAFLLFWGIFLYGVMFLSREVDKKMGELDGCFKTLEILGFLEKEHWTKRKKKTLKDLFEPMVKVWRSLKEKMQREPYGDAPLQSPVAALVSK